MGLGALEEELAYLSAELEEQILELCYCQEARRSTLAQKGRKVRVEQELVVAATEEEVVVVHGYEVQEDRLELAHVAGKGDDPDLEENLAHLEGQNSQEAEVHRVKSLGLGRSHLGQEVDHSLYQIVREGSSRQREEDEGSLVGRKAHREEDLEEVDLVVMRSKLSETISHARHREL